jgi:hypothetical protein
LRVASSALDCQPPYIAFLSSKAKRIQLVGDKNG